MIDHETFCFRIGAFSIFNTSIYSDEKLFKTSPVAKASTTDSTADNESQNTIVIAVALVVSLVVLVTIAVTLHCLMRRKKKHNKKNSAQYVPGLEDLIEMRTRTLSGGADSRGNRDVLELGGKNTGFVCIHCEKLVSKIHFIASRDIAPHGNETITNRNKERLNPRGLEDNSDRCSTLCVVRRCAPHPTRMINYLLNFTQ